MSSPELKGRFLWHDLMTTDAAAAGQFYPRVLGWKTQAWDPNPDYTLWVNRKNPIGGFMQPTEEMGDTPVHWMAHIGTPDIADTVEKARGLGGKVCKDITPLPEVGSFAILADPQGATFAVFQPSPTSQGNAPAAGTVSDGEFCWHELATPDPEAALSFYEPLFGWKLSRKHDMGEVGFYHIFAHGGEDVGGVYRLQPGMPAPYWLAYVRVKDVNRAVKAVNAGGGRVLNGPMQVPGGAWIAQLADPQGALFAVHQLPAAEPAKQKTAAPREVAETVTPEEEAAKPSRQSPRKSSRPAAKKKAVAAKKSAPAKKRAVAGKRVAKKSRGKAVKRASAKHAKAAAKRPAARKKAAKRSARGKRRR